MIHISHGPVGCGQYSWASRRNYYIGTTGIDSFGTMQFTSDFQEKDIVFGGDKKLEKLMDEIQILFPLNKGISVQSECPIGLIGDDIEAVSKKKSKESTTIPSCRCAAKVSAASRNRWATTSPTTRSRTGCSTRRTRTRINSGYALRHRHHRRLQHRRRCLVFAHPAGRNGFARHRPMVRRRHHRRNGKYAEGQTERAALLPFDELHFAPHGREVRHALGRVQLLRPVQDRSQSLREIASHFDDKIKEGAERVIAKYKALMDAVIAKYRPRLEGKNVMLYVGGLRPRHVIGAYEDLGMEVVGTGYEFGHNDDYQRTTHYVKDGTLIYDDVTGYEFEKFVDKIKPDLVGSGIKEKYVFQKMGVPFRQMHSWDYSGPYHGYDGFAIFARDMDMAINSPVWGLTKAPWKT